MVEDDDTIELLNVEIHSFSPAPPGYFAVTCKYDVKDSEVDQEVDVSGEIQCLPVVAIVQTENQFSDNTTETALRPYVLTNHGLVVDVAQLDNLVGFWQSSQKKKDLHEMVKTYIRRKMDGDEDEDEVPQA